MGLGEERRAVWRRQAVSEGIDLCASAEALDVTERTLG